MKPRGWSVFVLIAALTMVTLPYSAPARAQNTCTLTVQNDTTVYFNPDLSASTQVMPAGVSAMVMGETADQQWIGFDPGVAQAVNLGLTRLRWIPTSAVYTLDGDCSSLPVLMAPPPGLCILTFGQDVTAYTQPDTNSTVYTTLSPNDYAQVAGQLSDGWYAWTDPGAQAGATGTINLRWIQNDLWVQLSGNCDQIPALYPVPPLMTACTLLTSDQGQAYAQPATTAESEPLPGVLVQVLAQTADHWYGYDPGGDLDGAVGVMRLRWIPLGEISQLNGDCTDVPTVDPAPIELSAADAGSSITVHVGDTIAILLPSDPLGSGFQWVEVGQESGANNPAILQMQGAPHFETNGAETVTYQAVGVGQTVVSLAYVDLSTMAPPASNPIQPGTFQIAVTVTIP
jgi:hypothetical protein